MKHIFKICKSLFEKIEELFKDIDELKNLESTKFNKVTEIKTHAMNILRALFKHSQLGDLVKDYVGNGFMVAIKNYDGESWMVYLKYFIILERIIIIWNMFIERGEG